MDTHPHPILAYLLDTFRAFPTQVTSDLPYLAQGGQAPRENKKTFCGEGGG